MESLHIELMLKGQFWGSVIEHPFTHKILCFGSCVFVSDSLAKEILAGDHPFLLADFCEKPEIRKQILTLPQIEIKSKQQKLNFYGALFSFPQIKHTALFPSAMNALQESAVNSMKGFGISRYFKHSYGERVLLNELTTFAMRKRFGVERVDDYLRRYKYDGPIGEEVKRYCPRLFTLTRGEALRDPAAFVYPLLCKSQPEIKLPKSARWVLRLEIEGYSHDAIAQAMIQNQQDDEKRNRTADNGWAAAFDCIARNQAMAEYFGVGNPNRDSRDAVRIYVEEHKEELGVLPLLTPEESHRWEYYNNLDGVAVPSQKSPTKQKQAQKPTIKMR